MPPEPQRTLVFGGGNMAQAIIGGAIDGGARAPDRWLVVDPSPEKRSHFAAIGVSAFELPVEAFADLGGGGEILLAVKPQVFPALAREIAGLVGGRLVVSIMAGVGSRAIRGALGGACRVVRAMPNTPVRVRMGVTSIAPGGGATEADVRATRALFAVLGVTIRIEEDLIDAATAVAGSGPAYLFRFAEAMEAAARSVGLDADDARIAVAHTLRGAAELLVQPEADPAALRGAVTSSGGTTAAGLAALEEGGVDRLLCAVVAAARDRGRALGTPQDAS